MEDSIYQHIEDLTSQLEGLLPEILRLSGSPSVHSLHGVIGSKNDRHVDVVREQFDSPQQFIARWEDGALRIAEEHDQKDRLAGRKPRRGHAQHRIIQLLQDEKVRHYTHLFLERNFYRNHYARIRAKPSEALWEIWFGSNPLTWGLFICPRFGSSGWENDVSEIRHTEFRYWTVGHAMETGFLTEGRKEPLAVTNLDQFFALYQDVFIRSTQSSYGQELAKRYEGFVRSHDDARNIPLLLPEVRYAGKEVRHEHRLDFTILSAERALKVGIELSPWSSHGRVAGVKALRAEGGEAAVDAKRLERWENEMSKRNAYFQTFGISTLTFTDSQLANMDGVFSEIVDCLEPHASTDVSAPEVERKILGYRFD